MITLNIDRHTFNNIDNLSHSLADRVATELSLAIDARDQATLVVSGGTTPQTFFDYLSKIDIAWHKVIISLTDERFVAVDNARSNEKIVRDHLLKNFAAKARFIGLYMHSATAELAAFSAASRVNNLPRPFDVIILGMGIDGHTASFFSGGDRLKQAIDPQSRALVVPIHAKNIGEARLTLTLPLIIEAQFIALLITGNEKLEKFEEATQIGDVHDIPIRAVLQNAQSPVQLFWAPDEGQHPKSMEQNQLLDKEDLNQEQQIPQLELSVRTNLPPIIE